MNEEEGGREPKQWPRGVRRSRGRRPRERKRERERERERERNSCKEKKVGEMMNSD